MLNSQYGDYGKLDCPICKNKGVVYRIDGEYVVASKCTCMEIRQDFVRLEQSGLQHLIEHCNMQTFTIKQEFQKRLKDNAEEFLKNPKGNWFFVGGQVGAGKTHLCTAIAAEFLHKHIGVKYLLWCEDSIRIKSMITDSEEYFHAVRPFKTIPVLYIDDFLKTYQDKDGRRAAPSQADLRLALEIIGCRYNDNKTTILSSEWTMDEILRFDEALGSRIYERSKNYCNIIARDCKKNYRLK